MVSLVKNVWKSTKISSPLNTKNVADNIQNKFIILSKKTKFGISHESSAKSYFLLQKKQKKKKQEKIKICCDSDLHFKG